MTPESIANSTFIRAHIERKYGFDFDAGLDRQQRAQAWAFERMIEHHVYWALVGARWVDPDNFAKGPTHFFDGAPEHVRDKLREDAQFRVAENYLLSGLGRHAPGRRRRSRAAFAVCAVGAAWRQAVSDGRASPAAPTPPHSARLPGS